MNDFLSTSPYIRPVLGGLLALVVGYFLIKFIIRQVFFMVKVFLFLVLCAIGGYFYLDYTGYFDSWKSSSPKFSAPSEAEQTTPSQLYAQIVDTEPKDKFEEKAVVEGRAYKFLLQRAAKTSNTQVRKEVNERTTFENLGDEPDLHRGEAYATGRGVIVEASKEELTPDFGLSGYYVVSAIYVNSAHEVYGLKIVCPSSSKMYDTLAKAIKVEKLPVVNVAGLFFKNMSRMTGDPSEPPWIKPLLVCPEVEIVAEEEPRETLKELRESGNGRLLPSKPIEARPAEERLVLNVTLNGPATAKDDAGMKVRAWGEDADSDTTGFVKKAVAKLMARLPAGQGAHAAAVIVVAGAGTIADISVLEKEPRVQKVKDALKAAGVTRVCVKQEVVQPNAKTSGK